MGLRDTLPNVGDYLNQKEYYTMIESVLPYYRSRADAPSYDVEPHTAARFVGDFYGLLHSFGVGKKFHYVTMRLNGLQRSQDYDGLLTSITLVDESALNTLISAYGAKRR
jgi:hypothetical protein